LDLPKLAPPDSTSKKNKRYCQGVFSSSTQPSKKYAAISNGGKKSERRPNDDVRKTSHCPTMQDAIGVSGQQATASLEDSAYESHVNLH